MHLSVTCNHDCYSDFRRNDSAMANLNGDFTGCRSSCMQCNFLYKKLVQAGQNQSCSARGLVEVQASTKHSGSTFTVYRYIDNKMLW